VQRASIKAYQVQEKITSFCVCDYTQYLKKISRNICHLVKKRIFSCSQETNFLSSISTTNGIAANQTLPLRISLSVGLEVPAAVAVNSSWDTTPKFSRRFGRTYLLHFQDRRIKQTKNTA
jgi:hypothetical protein